MNVIVVGSGVAGLTAALHAHEAGHTVTVVTKGTLGDGCTGYAQGGVAGVYGAGDSAVLHAADTMTAGAGLSDEAAVGVLVADGAARIAELIARGATFDRSPTARSCSVAKPRTATRASCTRAATPPAPRSPVPSPPPCAEPGWRSSSTRSSST